MLARHRTHRKDEVKASFLEAMKAELNLGTPENRRRKIAKGPCSQNVVLKALSFLEDFRQARGGRAGMANFAFRTDPLGSHVGHRWEDRKARGMVIPQRRSDECLGSSRIHRVWGDSAVFRGSKEEGLPSLDLVVVGKGGFKMISSFLVQAVDTHLGERGQVQFCRWRILDIQEIFKCVLSGPSPGQGPKTPRQRVVKSMAESIAEWDHVGPAIEEVSPKAKAGIPDL